MYINIYTSHIYIHHIYIHHIYIYTSHIYIHHIYIYIIYIYIIYKYKCIHHIYIHHIYIYIHHIYIYTNTSYIYTYTSYIYTSISIEAICDAGQSPKEQRKIGHNNFWNCKIPVSSVKHLVKNIFIWIAQKFLDRPTCWIPYWWIYYRLLQYITATGTILLQQTDLDVSDAAGRNPPHEESRWRSQGTPAIGQRKEEEEEEEKEEEKKMKQNKKQNKRKNYKNNNYITQWQRQPEETHIEENAIRENRTHAKEIKRGQVDSKPEIASTRSAIRSLPEYHIISHGKSFSQHQWCVPNCFGGMQEKPKTYWLACNVYACNVNLHVSNS